MFFLLFLSIMSIIYYSIYIYSCAWLNYYNSFLKTLVPSFFVFVESVEGILGFLFGVAFF